MPPTLEAVCDNDDCKLDMFELHYSYELSVQEAGIDEFSCPYCGRSDTLRELSYTYRDSR